MARAEVFNYPYDKPAIESPERRYAERNAPGNDSHLITGGDNAVGAKKGDLSTRTMGIFPPRATERIPFKNLKQR